MNHTEFDDGHTKYVGQDFGLSGADTNSVQVFVGPSAAGAVSTDADNCAWYGVSNSAGSGANVTYSLPETPTFTSRTANFANDNSLGFDLDGNPTTGSNTKQLSVVLTKSGCTNAAASTLVNGWSGIDLANLYGSGATLSLTAAQLAKSLTSTSSSCTWTTKLSTYVPGGNTPAHDADTYTFTGPTITTTLTASGIYG